MNWMMYLISNFCKEKGLVKDTNVCTVATAKACVPQSDNGRFIGCEKRPARFLDVLSSLVEVYARQVLSVDCDRTGS